MNLFMVIYMGKYILKKENLNNQKWHTVEKPVLLQMFLHSVSQYLLFGEDFCICLIQKNQLHVS